MPPVWHNGAPGDSCIARRQVGLVQRGALQVPNRGQGRYHFTIDHSPHNHNIGTDLTGSPTVTAYDHQGNPRGPCNVTHDRYNDHNAAEWMGGNPETAFYVVRYCITDNTLRRCPRGTGFDLSARFHPAPQQQRRGPNGPNGYGPQPNHGGRGHHGQGRPGPSHHAQRNQRGW